MASNGPTFRPTSSAERRESPSERADRSYGEVVQELRVAQTGVQILFAFQLSLPFLDVFPHEDPAFVRVLTAALLSSAAAVICFLAPVASHRMSFRKGGKEAVLWFAHWSSIAGLLLLVSAIILSIWLVIGFVWSPGAATRVSLAGLAVIAVAWGVLPALLMQRVRARGGDAEGPDDEMSEQDGGGDDGAPRPAQQEERVGEQRA